MNQQPLPHGNYVNHGHYRTNSRRVHGATIASLILGLFAIFGVPVRFLAWWLIWDLRVVSYNWFTHTALVVASTFPLALGVAAFIFGLVALARDYHRRGFAQAGVVMGIAAILISIADGFGLFG